MAIELFADNFATTLTSSPSAGATSFTVASSTGAPAAVATVSQFRVIIGTEIVTVTNVSGTTWNCNALAAGHTSGDAVTHVVTSAAMSNLGMGGGDFYRSGYYSWGADLGNALQTTSLTLNKMMCRPFFVRVRRSFDRIGINVTTGGTAGAVLRMGIYSTVGGLPSALILDAGTVASTTTGAKEITISQTLDPGMYWLATAAQTATCTVTSVNTGSGLMLEGVTSVSTTPPSSQGFPVPVQDSVSGSLPAPFVGTPGSYTTTMLAVCLRAA